MSYESVQVTQSDEGVATVLLNEPERRNPLSPRLVRELTSALRDLERSEDCASVLVHGAGRGFCAGADLSRMRESSVAEDRAEYDAIIALNRLVWRYSKPTVAAVHGFALGGGCSLMAWFDFVVVADGTRLGLPEITGGVPSATVIPTLLRTIGRRATLELTLLGEDVPLSRALEIGLVSQVVASDQLLPRATELAGRLAAHDSLAVRLTKDIVSNVEDMTYDQAIAYAKDVRIIARATPSFSVGIGKASSSSRG